jgi:filamentous hemagglutinin family protein
MNLTCRLIGNTEPATDRSEDVELRIAHIACLFVLPLCIPNAWAEPAPAELPGGGQVNAGQASITVNGSRMDVNQTSQNAGIDWQTFNIGSDAQVNFHQPNSAAIAVNRIADANGSQIMGKLNANGQVYLINPNGVLFSKGSQVNVGGLVASTLDTADNSAADRRTFASAGGSGKIVNQGTLNAENGYIALLGEHVSNQGVIQAKLGTVALAAGDKITLEFSGDKLLNVEVDKGALQALAENKQLIQADGGIVLMTAKAADALLSTAVNNEGVIEARTVEDRNGVIKLLGDMDSGTVNVGGTLDASAPLPSSSGAGGEGEANGGFIETSAAHVKVADGAKITTKAANGNNGTWLIDPVDFTIAASGGDMTGAQVDAALLGGNFTIQSTNGAGGTSGNINVNDIVSWNVNKLTLNALNNININTNLNASGTANLALEYGQGAVAAGNTSNYYLGNGAQVNLPAGNNFSTKLGSDGGTTTWTVITALGAEASFTGTDLQGMSGNLAGNYVLGADIDASATSGWNGGAGFAPVGNNIAKFTGNFSGLGHTVTGLTINRLATNYVGLFGYATGTLRDIGLINSNISGWFVTGTLAGRSDGAVIYSYADGGSVTGDANLAGGLLGQTGGSVDYSYANVSVTGNSNGISSTAIGGLVGGNNGSISNSYATGSVHGGTDVGGLVGQVGAGATVTNAYSTGTVTWTTNGGGLVGSKNATGTVTASYWDTTTSGVLGSAAGTGLTTAQMQTMASFGGWSIANSGGSTAVWRVYEGHAYPLLRNFLTALTVTANNGTKTYDGLAYSGGNGVTGSISGAVATLSGGPTYGGSAQGAVNAGSYALTVDGYWSGQQGYDVSYAGGTLTVNQAPLTVTANGLAKTYDGLVYSGGNGVIYSGFVNGENSGVLGGALAYGGSSQGAVNAGSYAITPSGLTSSNYAISFANGTLTINPATLTVTALATNKVYDGLAWSGGNGVSYSGFVNGENANVLGGSLAYGGGSQGAVNAGSYAITPSGLTSSNYAISFANGTLTINPATLTVIALAANKTYDGLAWSGGNGVSYSGFVNGENANVLGGALVYGGSSQGAVNAGSYTITPSGLAAANYAINYASANLAVAPASLTYTATPIRFFSGQTLTGLTGTVNGFMAGDTLENSTVGNLAWTTDALTTSRPGQYAIYGGGLSPSNGNYVLAQAGGNATALTLQPGRPPETVMNTIALLEANPKPIIQPASATITVTQGTGSGTDNAPAPEFNSGMLLNSHPVTMNIGSTGSTLEFVAPGVKLPDNRIGENEDQ